MRSQEVGSSPLTLVVAAGGLIVVTVAITLAILLPSLNRVDRALEQLEQGMAVLDEVGPDVDRIEGRVGNIDPVVVRMGDELVVVSEHLEDLDAPLGSIDEQLGQLSGPLHRMEEQLGGVTQRLGPLTAVEEDLGAMRGSLGGMAEDMEGMRGELGATREGLVALAEVLERIDERFVDVIDLLEKTAEHVENLDRKTGPAPPDQLPVP